MPVFPLPAVCALGRYTLGLAALSLLALTGAQAQEDTDRTQVIAVKAATAKWSDPLEALGTLRATRA